MRRHTTSLSSIAHNCNTLKPRWFDCAHRLVASFLGDQTLSFPLADPLPLNARPHRHAPSHMRTQPCTHTPAQHDTQGTLPTRPCTHTLPTLMYAHTHVRPPSMQTLFMRHDKHVPYFALASLAACVYQPLVAHGICCISCRLHSPVELKNLYIYL